MKFMKLDIQFFATAFAEAENTSLKSSAGNKGKLYASLTEIAPTEEEKLKNQNRVKCYCKFTQVTGSYAQHTVPYLRLYWYDNNENKNGKEVAKVQVHTINYGNYDKVEELTATITVNHLDDGTLKGYVKAKWEYDGTGTLPCKTGYATTSNTTLTTIPRAKTIGAISSDIGYDTTITLGQTSELFTTTIEYECGELKDVIVDKTTLISIPWKIPTEFYSQLAPTDKEINVTLSATTYNGDTQIGSVQTTTLKARVNEADNKPEAYLDVEDINEKILALTNDPSKVVVNASSIKCNAQGMSKNGATIKSMAINGIELVDFTYRTPEGEYTEIALDEYVIEKPTTNVFTLTVTDSREFTNEVTIDNQKTLEKIDYIIPTISATFRRNTPVDGLVNVQYDGKFFKGDFKSGTSNVLEMAYQYKEKGTETYSDWIALTLVISSEENSYGGQIRLNEEFDYEKQFDFRISVKDLVNDYGVIFTTGSIAKGKPSHWYDDENFYVEGSYYQRDKDSGKWKKFKSGNELPVGSIYINRTDSTNPKDLLGYGEWNQIQGLNLIGAGTYTDSNGTSKTFTAGDVGGTYNHNHTQTNHIHARGTLTAALAIDASYIYSRWDTTANKNGTQTASWSRNARKTISGTNAANTASMTEGTPVIGNTGAMLTTAGASATIYTGSTYHLTPSLVVYMWERIA